MHSDDNLNDLERRLSAWAPASAGLDPDAMLFAAGRASAGRGRYGWPALSVLLAAVSVALGVWVSAERAERIALAEQLRRHDPSPPAPPVVPTETPSAEAPASNSLLAAHLGLEHGLDAWPPRSIGKVTASAPSAPVLEVRHRDKLLDP